MRDARDRLLAAAAALCALLAIASAPWALALPALNFVFKPLATIAIIAFAWRRGHAAPAVRRWVLAGLVASLAGDVALLWPQQGFLPGLVSFLLAHLAYLWAFTRLQPFAADKLPFVVYAAVAGGILALLWPGVPAPLRVPVVAYVVCLASMAAQAAVLWRAARRRAGAGRGALRRVRRAAGEQQVRRPAAAGVAVDPGQLLVGPVVHRQLPGPLKFPCRRPIRPDRPGNLDERTRPPCRCPRAAVRRRAAAGAA
jgi:uncharacterized membrane protein YhhN